MGWGGGGWGGVQWKLKHAKEKHCYGDCRSDCVFINERLKDAIFTGVIPVLHTGNNSVATPIFLPLPVSTDNASHVTFDSDICEADLAMQMNF